MKRSLSIDYRNVYALIALLSFLIWILGLLICGRDSFFIYVFISQGRSSFTDFFYSVGVASQQNPYLALTGEFQDHAYPPLAYAFYAAFRGFAQTGEMFGRNDIQSIKEIQALWSIAWITSALFVVLLVLVSIFVLKGSKLSRVLIALGFACSKPILYALERGNIIVLSLILSVFFIFFYNSKNKVLRELSLIALALAAGIKITPAILGLLLVLNKQWKEAVRTVIYGIVAFFLPFLFFEGGLSNVQRLIENMNDHFAAYKITDCTIFGCLQNLIVGVGFEPYSSIGRIVAIVVGLIIIGGIPFYKHNWQRILAFSMILIFMPSVSQFYCLIYIIPAIIAFLNENNDYSLSNILVFAAFCAITILEPFIFFSAIGELALIAYMLFTSCRAIIGRITARKPQPAHF